SFEVTTRFGYARGTGDRETVALQQISREVSSAARFTAPGTRIRAYGEALGGIRDLDEGGSTTVVWPYVQALRGHFLGAGVGATAELWGFAIDMGVLLRHSTTDRIAIDGRD